MAIKTALRATALLSGSSGLLIIIGLLSAKGRAILLGPEGIGTSALLLTLMSLPLLMAGLGTGVGLVRYIPAALARSDFAQVAALLRAGWLLRAGLGAASVLTIALLRAPVSRLLFGSERFAGSVVVVSIALGFSLTADLLTSTLSAYHRVRALASMPVVSAFVGSAIGLGIIWVWRSRGIAPAMLASAVVSCIVASYFVKRHASHPEISVRRPELLRSVATLVRFGGPYTGSLLVGTGIQLAMPLIVLHVLGLKSVGFYQAAVMIAGTYMGFLLNSMAQDYLPRLAAVSQQPQRLVELINEQQRLVLILTVPLILFLVALAPYLIPIVYSSAFGPTFGILQWQLLGDILKFSSWTMSFAVLASSNGLTYFVMELLGGALCLGTSWAGMHFFGLQGLGLSWLALYAAYFGVAWLIVRRDIPLIWTSQNKRMMAGTICLVLVTGMASISHRELLRFCLTVACALVAALISLRALRTEVGNDFLSRHLQQLLGRRSRTELVPRAEVLEP